MATKDTPGPSVKDDELYEKLRDQGTSKEKAARIANSANNSSRARVSAKGGQSGSYDDCTAHELRDRARELGLDGRSAMNRDELVQALRDH